jgi:hypothetical protein
MARASVIRGRAVHRIFAENGEAVVLPFAEGDRRRTRCGGHKSPLVLQPNPYFTALFGNLRRRKGNLPLRQPLKTQPLRQSVRCVSCVQTDRPPSEPAIAIDLSAYCRANAGRMR